MRLLQFFKTILTSLHVQVPNLMFCFFFFPFFCLSAISIIAFAWFQLFPLNNMIPHPLDTLKKSVFGVVEVRITTQVCRSICFCCKQVVTKIPVSYQKLCEVEVYLAKPAQSSHSLTLPSSRAVHLPLVSLYQQSCQQWIVRSHVAILLHLPIPSP